MLHNDQDKHGHVLERTKTTVYQEIMDLEQRRQGQSSESMMTSHFWAIVRKRLLNIKENVIRRTLKCFSFIFSSYKFSNDTKNDKYSFI